MNVELYIAITICVVVVLVVVYQLYNYLIGRKLFSTLKFGDELQCEWYLAASLFDSRRTRYFTVLGIDVEYNNSVTLKTHDNGEVMTFTARQAGALGLKRKQNG
jgi:hypothetical protein